MRLLRARSITVLVCLIAAGTVSLAVGPAATPVSLTTDGAVYSEPFDSLGASGTGLTTVPPGWTFDESLTNANGAYVAGTGSSTAGDTYSFGTTGSGERALGQLRSGNLASILGAAFTNDTGGTIVSLDITYAGEQWRYGGPTNRVGIADRLDFQYSTTATGISNASFTNPVDVDALDFTSPIFTGSAGALDGNAAANRTLRSATISGLSIPNGATFWIRWNDVDISGSEDGLAIDDFFLTPHVGEPTTNPTGTGSASPALVSPGDTTLLTIEVTPGTNPASTGLAVTADLSAIGGFASQRLFDDGTNGDAAAGDSIFSVSATVAPAASPGPKTLPITITDEQSRTGTSSIALTVDQLLTPIHSIQGSGLVSPVAAGTEVATEGIVTGVKFNGFFIQAADADVDTNANSSEAIFVFTSSTPPSSVVIGNRVHVTGRVSEFGTVGDPAGLSATELTNPAVTLVSTGNPLPAAITIPAAALAPTATFATLERYEGMRVHLDQVVSTSPTGGSMNATDEANARSISTGLFFAVLPGTARPFREPGIQAPLPVPPEAPAGATPPVFDGDYERIGVDTFSVFPDPATAALFPPPAGSTLEVTTGVTIDDITGPLDYSFRSYIIDAESWQRPTIHTGSANRTIAPVRDRNPGEFTVASVNMERFFDTSNDSATSDAVLTAAAYQGRLRKMSMEVRDILKMPDVIGVEEMEHLSTLQDLADRINADAAAAPLPEYPGYQAFLAEGNDIGGIDSGFLVRSDHVDLAAGHFTVTQYGKDYTFTGPGACGNSPLPACLNDRPPLVLDAGVLNPPFEPYRVTVIVNHLRSLSGIDGGATDPLGADGQDALRIRTKRRLQAEYLAQLIKGFQDQGKRVVSVGDYNAFQFNDGYVDAIGIARGAPAPHNAVTQDTTLAPSQLPTPPLVDLVNSAPADERYSFVFDGIAQELDHILVTNNLQVNGVAWGRVNADFPESYRADVTRPERVSDHDPIVAYFNLEAIDTTPPVITVPSDITIEGNTAGGATVTFSATAHDGSDGDVAPVCTPASGAVFPLGTTTASCIATDNHGNSATGTFHVTVVDTTPPELTLPLDTTIEATNPGGARFTYTASAFDIVSGSVAVTCSSPSGSTFALGPTVVACTAVDGSGNAAHGSFTVVVADTTPPTVVIAIPLPLVIWPPNGRLVPVEIKVLAFDAVSAMTSRITRITANDGATPEDWRITGALTALLRAERSGQGIGRVYTFTIDTTDAAGNTTTSTAAVFVPHDQRK